MSDVQQKKVLQRIVQLMKQWLDGKEGKIDDQPEKKGFHIDLIQKTENWTFVYEHKNSGDAPAVAYAIESLNRYAKAVAKNAVPVVVVPFMGEVGRRICRQKGVSWLDLSGNANIKAPGLRIHVEGKTNAFKSAGRPKNIFAPKSSRITRHLLIDPERFITQRELTNETKLDEGLVSRVVREMERSGLLIRDSVGAVKSKDSGILLDSWYEKYDFSKHQVIKGHIAERTSDAVLSKISAVFEMYGLEYALTGLSAAWILSKFATFRTSSVYLREAPSPELLKELNFVKGEKGSNVWLVVPNDEGVFDGVSGSQGINCVHPVQVYLDLKSHPERSKEASEEIRSQYLNWRGDGI
jgi:hypothetical protein